MKPSIRWERRVALLDEFLDAARALAVAYEAGRDDDRQQYRLERQPPHDEEVLRARVARASGPAGRVVGELGLYVQIAGMSLNPVMAWDRFIPGEMLSYPQQVLEFAESARAQCAAKRDEARDRERGLAGWLGRFVRFPADVREAAGLESAAGQRAAFAVGVVVQVVGTLVAAALLAAGGWALSRL